LINPLGGGVGIGTLDPTGDLEVHGPGQATFTTFNQAGALGGTIALRDDDGSSGSGGAVMFGTNAGFHAAIKANLVDGSNNTAGDLSFYTRSATTDSTMGAAMTIRNNKNVGIGTTNPDYKLKIEQGHGNNSNGLFISNTNYGSMQGLNISMVNSGSGNFRTYAAIQTYRSGVATAATDLALNPTAGNVGIGTTNPAAFLHVFRSDHGLSARIGGYDGVLDIGTLPTTYGAETVYLRTKIDGGTGYVGERQVLALQPDAGSRVGIGDTQPFCKLSIGSGGSSSLASGSTLRSYFGAADTDLLHDTGTGAGVDVYARGWVGTNSGFIATNSTTFSDERIKKNIVDADDVECLNILRQLKPKKYNYIDTVQRGETPVWGFIAQEVEQVLSYSTHKFRECIPNIYELANVSESNVITFTNFNTSNLEENSNIIQVRTITDDMRFVTHMEVIDEHSIRVKEDLTDYIGVFDEEGNVVDGNKLFIYGQRKEDVRGLKKDAIWTVATAALQEVDRQQQAEKAKVTTLETQVTNLLGRVQALESA
jgi:hypothetical protein